MDCVYIGYFRDRHFGKRKKIGSNKASALKSMIQEHIDPSVYRRNQAQTLMREGNL